MAKNAWMPRRLSAAAFAVLLLPNLFPATSAAQSPGAFPVKPVRVVLPVPPGGLQDTLARGITQELTRIWGQSALVENRPGAGGITAANAVATAAPDGYTLLMADRVPLTITPYIVTRLPYDAARAFTPVVGLAQSSSIVIAPPDAPFNTMAELISVARAKPGALNYGSFGQGSNNHLDTERLATEAGVRFTHVPYKGGADIMRGAMAGDIHFALTGMTAALPLFKQGRLKPIAFSGAQRSPALPDVPTLSEAVPGYVTTSWFGWFAPAGTPPAVVQKIATDTLRVLAAPEVQAKFIAGVGLEPFNVMPEAFAKILEVERVRNAALVKQLGLKQD